MSAVARQKRIPGVMSCGECPRAAKGCSVGCEDMAIRKIMTALELPEVRKRTKLYFDLQGIKVADITRNLRKKSQSRRR